MSEVKANRKVKDVLFRFIFGREENKPHLLELYNAVNGSHYTNVNDLKLTTLEDVVYINMKNDVSFILDSEMSLYEHQSTFSPNMPIRGLLYFASLYNSYLEQSHQWNHIYRTKKVKIPTPRYIVFYNGTEEQPDRQELKLSDLFEKNMDTGCEWTATVININAGRNKELMEACKILRDYADFVHLCRTYSKECEVEDAVSKAIDETIARKNTLYDIMLKNRAEVIEMFLSDFNQEEYDEGLREEGREEGREGLKEALLTVLQSKGEVSELVKGKVNGQSDMETLNAWLKLAISVDGIEAFMEGIERKR